MSILILILLPILTAPLVYFAKDKKSGLMEKITVGTLGVCFLLSLLLFITGKDLSLSLGGAASDGLFFMLDGFRRLYSLLISFAFLASGILALEYLRHGHNNARYYLFLLFTLGAVNGVFFSADLMTAFTFYEIASFTSFVWVIHEETPGAVRAGKTYLAIAVVGGLVAFMGILLIKAELGTLLLSALPAAAEEKGMTASLFAGGICVLLGFGAKAGMFPLHIWLPKAHPVAPAPASALLSGILTKVGIYGAAAVTVNVFLGNREWGILVLILGTITMVLGGVMGVLSIDLKRTLACSSMSQIGFILVGLGSIAVLGEENTISAYGTVLHMMNHSLFKIILFCCAGVVYMNLHKLDLNVIRGFGRGKYLLMVPFLIGSVGIGGIPLFSGYISKTLLHEGLLETAEFLPEAFVKGVECLFLFSGGCTVAYMTKLFVAVFIEKNTKKVQKKYDEMTSYVSAPSFIAIACAAVPVILCGMPPVAKAVASHAVRFFRAEGEIETAFFGWEAIKGGLTSILIGAAVYWLSRKLTMKNGRYVNIIPEKFDLEDSVYKPVIALLSTCFGFACEKLSGLLDSMAPLVEAAGYLCKAVSLVIDGFVLAMRRTLIREKQPVREMSTGSALTDTVGFVADKITKTPEHKERFAALRLRIRRADERIEESFTFAFAMTCIGICIVLVVLILYKYAM